ncbi:MAG: prepilin-type N-terminal cleavage/methylation domain-containing protein [Longimicrobiales bacterium]
MRNAREGFTLVELLVGLTVASLALAAGFATLAFVRDRGEHAEASARGAVAGATQRALLMDWLSSARFRAPAGQQFEGVDQEEDGKARDMLLFPTTAVTPLDGAYTIVGLYIDEDPETPEQGLVAELTGVVPGQAERRMQLVPQADVLHIRYLPGSPTQSDWMDGWNGQNRLPRGVEIVLEPAPGDTLPVLLRLPMRVALGARW